MKKTLPLLLVLAILSACAASGAKISSIDSGFPKIESDKGRLYFYRVYNSFGAGMRENILIDGVAVGRSIPGGAFYTDVSAGEHVVTISAIMYPGQSTLNIKVQPGEIKYIKTWIGGSGFIGRINIDIALDAEARALIGNLSYTGKTK